MLRVIRNALVEDGYEIKDEAKHASILGIGNGYFGVRGSFEEFGDVFVQGTYIRGVFDEIIEIPQTFCDNIYMKNYYFDVQKLKEFEYEDSCINICDFTLIRFYINGKLFLPWHGKVLKWKRYIDFNKGSLKRTVLWDDGEGNITEFNFERTCSFHNNHLFFQKAYVRKINHDLPVEVMIGVDTLVKTNGQHKSQVIHSDNKEGYLKLQFSLGNKYHMESALSTKMDFGTCNNLVVGEEKGVYYTKATATEKEFTVSKIVYMNASCDYQEKCDLLAICDKEIKNLEYRKIEKEHLSSYHKYFALVDVKIKDDPQLDVYLRYANYQTLIGIDRYDQVHSLSAKNLTAEKYNQFVWWDCEILQLPIFLATLPEESKRVLMYRYKCLNEARKIAKQNGYEGAQFAFCSSVDGKENVWSYARHPFLQIHITADVGYGIINYYRHTLDLNFIKDYGLEMLLEISRYFISRMTYKDNIYQILNVTGTDEHHPYINNNAYTNYEVHFVLSKTIEFMELLGITSNEKDRIQEVVNNLYLPKAEKGIIPQFDGYLKLKPYLPLVGNGSAKGFQMKQSGLYHESQIIKQPDVMNLFAYLNLDITANYKKNWHYYEKMCEASSSLTYPVHGICAIDNGEYDKFKKYLLEAIKIDIDDLHNCAYQGVHAGCIAGGWYMIYRGLCGFEAFEDYLKVNPHFAPNFKNVQFDFIYHGVKIKVTFDGNQFILKSRRNKEIKLKFKNKIITHKGVTIINADQQIIHI